MAMKEGKTKRCRVTWNWENVECYRKGEKKRGLTENMTKKTKEKKENDIILDSSEKEMDGNEGKRKRWKTMRNWTGTQFQATKNRSLPMSFSRVSPDLKDMLLEEGEKRGRGRREERERLHCGMLKASSLQPLAAQGRLQYRQHKQPWWPC